MGRSITPKYVVETTENFGRKQVMAWNGRLPTAEKLAAWVETYNASFDSGGVNFHCSKAVGYIVYASAAIVRRNVPGAAALVTHKQPMFSVR